MARDWVERQKSAGKCVSCGLGIARPNKVQCDQCSTKNKTNSRKWKKSHPLAMRAAGRRYRDKYPEESLARNIQYKRDHFEVTLIAQARCRARKRGQPFSITVEDVHVPDVCPVLGVRLQRKGRDGRSAPDFPTLDCLIPVRGYVPGNVFVISSRANRLKSNASWQDLQKVADWIRSEVSRAEG